MKNKQRVFTVILSSLVSVFLVAGVVMATTTIGTAISNNSSTTTGIALTGTYSTAAIKLGTSSSPLDFSTTATTRAIEVNTTSTATAATNVLPVYINAVMAGIGGQGRGMEVKLTIDDVALGAHCNAIKGYTDFNDTGTVAGLGSAVVAELRMAGGAVAGNYYPLEIELEFQSDTNITPIGGRAGFIYAKINGTTTDFDDDGDFMKIEGVVAEVNHLLSLTSQTLRSRVAGTDRYLVLSQMQDGLGLGVSGTPMDFSTTSANKAIAVYTTSSSTSTSVNVLPVYIDATMTGANGQGRGMEVKLTIDNAKLGAHCNAIKGYVDFNGGSGVGMVTGLGSAIVAEMKMAGGAMTHGTYAVMELELVCPASWTGNFSTSFIHAQVSGTTSGNFDDYGYFFTLTGVASDAAHMWYEPGSAIAAKAIDEFIRVKTPGGVRYIPLYNDVAAD